ncbi:TOMM precursor leader peptide-binding protein [Staphylococcus pseudintermedius]|uniref:TOMM precursor leader peptide-binding protein n=1 Tax=Staphylococcus pseudintermedius TaxID=283734 RepID=UPI0035BECD9B
MDDKYLYFLAPNVTLGTLDDSLIGLRGDNLVKIEGSNIIDFVTYLDKIIEPTKGMSFDELKYKLNANAEELENVLNFLVDNKILSKYVEGSNSTIKMLSDRSGYQVDTLTMLDRMKTTRISVICNYENPISTGLAKHLKEKGMLVTQQSSYNEDDLFRVVIAQSHIDPLLEKINAQALIDKKPWVSIIPYDGKKAWIGPFYIPDKSACNYCYNLRKSANFSDEVLRHKLMDLKPLCSSINSKYTHDASLDLIQIGLAGNLITEYVLLKEYASNAIPGGIQSLTVDNSGISMDQHRVFKVPRCPKCSAFSNTGYPQVWFHEEGHGCE